MTTIRAQGWLSATLKERLSAKSLGALGTQIAIVLTGLGISVLTAACAATPTVHNNNPALTDDPPPVEDTVQDPGYEPTTKYGPIPIPRPMYGVQPEDPREPEEQGQFYQQ